MDLTSVVGFERAFKVTWQGNSEVEKLCEQNLLKYFGDNTIIWERNGRQLPSPLHVKLPLQFCPFSVDLVVKETRLDLEETAILHFYFMKPTSVEEYRTKCRNDVTEWFAAVNSTDGVEWIVVFDSTKAREKRNRGAVVERIKNDFARFTNRLIEIDENAADSMVSLQTAAKVRMLSSLDKFISNEEGILFDLKEEYYKPDFDYVGYSNAQMQLIQLYHSLNVIERVLAKLDELDALASLIIGYFVGEAVRPKWISNGSAAVSEACPLLSIMAHQKKIQEPYLLDIRTFVTAQKMIASLLLYRERIALEPQSKVSSNLQIKTDFAAIVLRHAYHCLIIVFENLASLKLYIDEARLQCWTLSFCLETFQMVNMVAENVFGKNLSYFVCSISVLKCKAIASLLPFREQCERFLIWFDKATQFSKNVKSSDALIEFRNSFLDDNQLANFIQKSFETSIVLLKQFGWERQQCLLGYKLGTIFLDMNRPKFALPYLIRVIFLFIRDESPLLSEVLPFLITNFESYLDLCLEEVLQFYMVLSLLGQTKEERLCYCQKLMEKLEKVSKKLMWSSKHWKRYMPLCWSFVSNVPQIIATPGEQLRFPICVLNKLPVSIPRCEVRCVFKKMVNTESVTQLETRPQYKCSYSVSEMIARFGCVLQRTSLSAEKRGEEILSFESASKNLIIFKTVEATSFLPECGCATMQMEARALHFGVFTLDRLEVTILDSLVLLFSWDDFQEASLDPSSKPICFIYKKMPTVRLTTTSESLFAGIAQLLEFEVCYGSEIDTNEDSRLEVETASNEMDLEFWCPLQSKWLKKCLIPVRKSSPGSTVNITLYVCCSLNRVEKYCSEEDVRLFFKELLVKWYDLEWKFGVSFNPLLRVRTATTLLEDKLLLELQFLRSDSTFWVIKPLDAFLVPLTFDIAKQAKLLNPKLTEILPSSSYRMVWLLNGERSIKNDVEEFRLSLKYQVHSIDGHLNPVPKAVYDRMYRYEDTFAVPNRKASYELFAQILSAQPGAVLCRVNSPCDLIVSLRSLSNRVETVVISIDAEDEHWSINERHKFLYVKESGLGQTSFSIVPKTVGFLPYPSVTVYRCQHQRSSSDKSVSPRCEQSDFGARVPSFVRSGGKQVHVLGLHHSASDQKKIEEKPKRFKEAKNRLAKFFD